MTLLLSELSLDAPEDGPEDAPEDNCNPPMDDRRDNAFLLGVEPRVAEGIGDCEPPEVACEAAVDAKSELLRSPILASVYIRGV